MDWTVAFFANSALLGVGLAMDAFSVSLANGLRDPGMGRRRMALIAGTFAFFQFLMPVAGWLCVRTVASAFAAFQRAVPWIALGLLGYIGGKMLYEGSTHRESAEEVEKLGGGTLLMQGVAICVGGLLIGRRFGTKLSDKASILGGAILVLIGVEIFIKNMY